MQLRPGTTGRIQFQVVLIRVILAVLIIFKRRFFLGVIDIMFMIISIIIVIRDPPYNEIPK